MPISPLQEILTSDKLVEGTVKLNSNFDIIEAFVNLIETSNDNLTPEDIQNLIVDGKVNPFYLPAASTVSVTATDVSVTDTANNFVGTNVETVLAEISTALDNTSGGSTWYAQAGVPAGGLGSVGDFYLDTTSGDVYEKTGATSWTVRFNIKGEAGAPGAGTGDVVGPSSSVNGNFAVFDGTTGKIIQDLGISVSTFATSAQGDKADAAVQPSRIVSGANSIVGGGDLSSNRTFSLINDEANPGINKVYGTNSSGVKVWKDDPVTSGGTSSTATSISVSASRSITDADHNKILMCTGTLTLTLPDSLQQDLQFAVLNVGTGIVTFATSGTSTVKPGGVILNNSTGAEITAATVLNVSDNWYISSTRQDTVTVIYSSAWPVQRPNAVHVLAIGHTSAPVWLTSEDVWFQSVA